MLDVGCGDGYVTRAIAARLPHGSVVGIDASPRMIEAARSRPDPAGAELRFEVGDVLDLPFGDEFDLVVSFNVLHWLVDQQAALSAIAGATRTRRPGDRPAGLRRPPARAWSSWPWRSARDPVAGPRSPISPPPFIHVDPERVPGDRRRRPALPVIDADGRATSTGTSVHGTPSPGGAPSDSPTGPPGCPPDEVGAGLTRSSSDYQVVVGRPGLFRFLQLRAELTR